MRHLTSEITGLSERREARVQVGWIESLDGHLIFCSLTSLIHTIAKNIADISNNIA